MISKTELPVLFVGVLNMADGVIATDKGVVLGAGIPGAHICDNIPIPGGVFIICDADGIGRGRDIGMNCVRMIAQGGGFGIPIKAALEVGRI